MQADPSDNRARLQTAWGGALSALIASAMLFVGLNSFSMWYDEVRMVLPTLSWNPLTMGSLVFRSGHPPLYFILLRLWITLCGQSDFSLRVLSGLFGLLTVALLIRIGKDLSGKLFVGVAAALLFGAMGTVRYYVHQTHNYALLMLACMLMLLFFERWWARPKRRAYVVGSVIATAGLMYTHYYGVFFALAILLFVVIAGWRRVQVIWRWLGLQALAAVLYVPWLGVIVFLARRVLSRLDVKPKGTAAPGINTFSTKWVTVVLTVNTLLADQRIVFGLLLIAGIVGIVLLVRSQRDQARKLLEPVLLLAILVIFSVVIALAVNLLYRTFSPRRVIFVLPALALLLAYLLVGLPRYLREGIVVAAAVLVFAGGYSAEQPGDWGFRQMIQTVAAGYQPGDLVLIQTTADSLSGVPLTYYVQTLLPHAALMDLGDSSLSTLDSQKYFAGQVFEQRTLGRDSFWVVSSDNPDYGEASLAWVNFLDRRWTQAGSARFGAFVVTHYTAIPQLRGDLTGGDDVSSTLGLPVSFGHNQFELDRAQVSSSVAHPGDTLTIWLDWRALTPPDQDYAIFVHLLKGSTLMAQQDGDPADMGHPLPTTLWPDTALIYDVHQLVVPANTPVGAYSLEIGLYSRVSGTRLRVVPPNAKIDSLELEAVEVVNP